MPYLPEEAAVIDGLTPFFNYLRVKSSQHLIHSEMFEKCQNTSAFKTANFLNPQKTL